MSYNQVRFLVFLLVFLCIYFVIRHKTIKKIWILLGNIFFCIWSGWAGLVIVFGTAVVVYCCSLLMEQVYKKAEKEKAGLQLKPKEQVVFLAKYKRKAKKYLWLAMLLILGIWVYVKIGKFMGMSSVVSFQQWFSGMGIIVPLGNCSNTITDSMGYLY